ncbi:MAG: DUF3365 domain-containing protein [Candidatus Omnitrophica bacterium]|nr:DUF3365 domain-containing protein [Candidatus Omnitrophota bacterium]
MKKHNNLKKIGAISKSNVVIALTGWTILVFFLILFSLLSNRNEAFEMARMQAEIGIEKDMIYRQWNAMQGGVYVPLTEKTSPNPYLDVEDKVIETTKGMKLTLINPAYMTRQVQELASTYSDIKGHITSLNPIRPGNAPDEWETRSLQSMCTRMEDAESLATFQKKGNDVCSLDTIDGKPYLRLMRPFYVNEGCLKCHSKQGYKEGDLRGGISVSIPMEQIIAVSKSDIRSFLSAIFFSGWAAFSRY